MHQPCALASGLLEALPILCFLDVVTDLMQLLLAN
jgi:hypothetical protein